jgi:flagellar biosynthesis/type III secretory pathway chaperone
MAKVRERLAVSKQIINRVHMERFNLKILNEVEGKEQYHIEISNRFAVSENLEDKRDINRAWETITENTKISAKDSLGYYELKSNKP